MAGERSRSESLPGDALAERVRAFLTYAREGRPEGRWGSALPAAQREARPSTVNTCFRVPRAFANWCLAEGLLSEMSLKNVKAPRVPVDQVQPLTTEQVQSLVSKAKRTNAPERNVAIFALLVDTGLRVSELCSLTVGQLDRSRGELTVLVLQRRLRMS